VMPIDDPKELTGELVLKCQLGKIFNCFRNIRKKETQTDFLRGAALDAFSSCLRTPCPFPNKDGIWFSQAQDQLHGG